MAYQTYKELEIYKLAHKLAIEIHEMSLSLPKFEMFEEGRQIRKSSKSIANTIFETNSLKDNKSFDYFSGKYNELGRMIAGFIKSVEFSHKTKIKTYILHLVSNI